MTAAAATLAIRPLERSGEDPALVAALARLIVDSYPVMGITTTDALETYAEAMAVRMRDDDPVWVVAMAMRDDVLADGI
jgi:hypothetical protein